jgi:hypothetical protein
MHLAKLQAPLLSTTGSVNPEVAIPHACSRVMRSLGRSGFFRY